MQRLHPLLSALCVPGWGAVHDYLLRTLRVSEDQKAGAGYPVLRAFCRQAAGGKEMTHAPEVFLRGVKTKNGKIPGKFWNIH